MRVRFVVMARRKLAARPSVEFRSPQYFAQERPAGPAAPTWDRHYRDVV